MRWTGRAGLALAVGLVLSTALPAPALGPTTDPSECFANVAGGTIPAADASGAVTSCELPGVSNPGWLRVTLYGLTAPDLSALTVRVTHGALTTTLLSLGKAAGSASGSDLSWHIPTYGDTAVLDSSAAGHLVCPSVYVAAPTTADAHCTFPADSSITDGFWSDPSTTWKVSVAEPTSTAPATLAGVRFTIARGGPDELVTAPSISAGAHPTGCPVRVTTTISNPTTVSRAVRTTTFYGAPLTVVPGTSEVSVGGSTPVAIADPETTSGGLRLHGFVGGRELEVDPGAVAQITTTALFGGVASHGLYTANASVTAVDGLVPDGRTTEVVGTGTCSAITSPNTAVTLTPARPTILRAHAVRLSGRVLHHGTPAARAPVTVSARSVNGVVQIYRTTTDVNGRWTLTAQPWVATSFIAAAGDATSHPVSVRVARVVTISAPHRVAAGQAFTVSGHVLDGRTGELITIRGSSHRVIGTARLLRYGLFHTTIHAPAAAGTTTISVTTPTRPGLVSGTASRRVAVTG